jgi:predicted O-linked N-acetylglucosamine transferase (SPINDLY family)
MGKNIGLRAFQNARLRKQQKKTQLDAWSQPSLLHQTGHVSKVQARSRETVPRDSGHFDVLHLLGVTEFQAGRYEEAERILQQALRVNPRSTAAHANRGIALHELKRFDEALACFAAALALTPDHPETYSNRGNTLMALARFDEALASYDRAIAIKPDYADALVNRGNVLVKLHRFDEAVVSCDRAIAIRPRDPNALVNRGNALVELGRFDDALASYDQALAIKPDLPSALLGRGNVLFKFYRYEDAASTYKRALAAKPDYYKALLQLTVLHERLGGDIDEVIAGYDRVLAIKPDSGEAISARLTAMDFSPTAGFSGQQNARKLWWEAIGSKIAARSRLKHANSIDPMRRLTVGYVSADFRAHSAAFSFGPVILNHDKAEFETICYSGTMRADVLTEQFRQSVCVWRSATQLSADALAAQIQADRVDILIDLSGHSEGHRLEVFARKPAPVQVTAWGHANGTGLPTVDYLFSDPVAIPNNVRHVFAEKVYDLPCLLPLARPDEDLWPADPPVLARGYVTFGAFNRILKISDGVLRIWAQILDAAPQSRLVIKDGVLDNGSLRDALMERAARCGIAAHRIDLLGATSRGQHLAAFERVDICLDPFPQNGGVSTWESLHMGVPVVCLLGNSPPSRMSAAILTSIGLNEWIARDLDEYRRIALNHASRPEALKMLRQQLPARIAQSEAGNIVHYTRAVEKAYRTMWQAYCAGHRS